MVQARLLSWIAHPTGVHEPLFGSGAQFDSPLSTVRTVRELFTKPYAPFEEVRPLAAMGDAKGGVVVFEARDPVTNLWHRVAWAYTAHENMITHVVETISQGLPPPNQRRSLLVHEVWRDKDGLEMCCLAGPGGEDARALLGPNAHLLHLIEAGSHFEAMSLYNAFLRREPYTTS